MRILLLVLFWLFSLAASAQYFSREPKCGRDTSIRYRAHHYFYDSTKPYRAIDCERPTYLGVRFDVGYMPISTGHKTSSWIGTIKGGAIGVGLAWKHWNYSLRVKFGATDALKMLTSGTDTTFTTTGVQLQIVDNTVGYSFDFKHNVSVEPYIGLTQVYPYGLRYERDTSRFAMPHSWGPTVGVYLNKYFRVDGLEHFCVFASVSATYCNFSKINSALGKGYTDWSVGMAYKGFYKHRYEQEVR